MTEHRYKVVEFDYNGKFVIGRVAGERGKATVKVSRNKIVNYCARISVDDWDRLSLTPEAAKEQWIKELKERVETSRNRVKTREVELWRALQEVATLQTKDIR